MPDSRNGYIGRAPADSAVTVARQTFSPTGVTTDFTFVSGYVPGYFDIFINGVKMIEGSDYTSTDGSTFSILNGGADNGDVIEGVAYKAFNAATATIGINSSGTPIGSVNALNFVGTGNTFALRGSSIDISISGGGGAGAGGTFAVNSTGIHTTKSVGIGTTTATGAADTNNTAVLNVGIVTANSLFGALTGDVTGDVTGNVIGNVTGNASGTAGGLSGTPNITVGRISAAGGDLTIRNITGVAATFTGVLTYEDVTNVDSVGLVTARSGLRVVGGGITVTGISTFFVDSSTQNVQFRNTSDSARVAINMDSGSPRIQFISADNDTAFISGDSNANVILSAGNTLNLRANTSETVLQGDGDTGIYASNVEKLTVNSGGINVSGIASATAFAGYDYLQAPFSSRVDFAVTVASKTAAHRYNGTGSGNGYLIDGVEAPFLTLTPGRTYRFVHDNTGSHPLKFYLEADKTTLYSTGVTFDNTYTEIVVSDSTPQVLHYQCTNHGYMGNAVNTNSNVAATQSAGISTEAATPSNAVVSLNLSNAQDHKVTATGICTITTTAAGTEGESHTVRIVNSGIATVGFSTYFLFPSGSAPVLPTADGAISLISFTVHDSVGAGCTQLLAGASVNYS